MSLGDIANFRVGKVLPLQCNDFTAIRLQCSGRGMFTCKLGQGDGRYRLEIESPIAQGPEAAERYTLFFAQSLTVASKTSAHGRSRHPLRASQRSRPAKAGARHGPSQSGRDPFDPGDRASRARLDIAAGRRPHEARPRRDRVARSARRHPVDVVVNGTVVARGEIVVVDEATQRFGVSLLEVVAGAGLEQVA